MVFGLKNNWLSRQHRVFSNSEKKEDGHITGESEVGVGTTFSFYLPAHEKDFRGLESIEAPKPEKPPIYTGRILLMDDEEMLRSLGEQMLNRIGYDAELAKAGLRQKKSTSCGPT